MSFKSQTLAIRQQELISMIFNLNISDVMDKSVQAGLRVYQNNLLMTAARSLSISYPVMQKLLSHDTMVALAQLMLKKNPPNTGDWADWGEELVHVLAESELMAEHPYLADMAVLEWQLHCVSKGADQSPEPSTLFLLEEHDASELAIQISSTVKTLSSSFPVDAIWQAHQVVEHSDHIDNEELIKTIREQGYECTLLLYENSGTQLSRLDKNEYQWWIDIQQGCSVSELLDRHPEIDFVGWLSKAIEHNWIQKIYVINQTKSGDSQ